MYSKYIMFSYPQSEPLKKAYSNEPLQKSSLGYATNNVYQQLPPRMNDSRSLVASYQPESILNNNLIKQNNIQSNWQYRKFLTENSQQIAQENFKEAANDCGYFQRFTVDERGYFSDSHKTPLDYSMYKDKSTVLNEQSDLKQLYLTKEQLDNKKKPVTLTQEQLFSSLAK